MQTQKKAGQAKRNPTAATKPKVPTYVLSIQNENGDFVRITGLFERNSKKGTTYYSGFDDNEEGLVYMVFLDDKTGLPNRLSKSYVGKEGIIAVADLKQHKNGFVSATDGIRLSILPYKPKED